MKIRCRRGELLIATLVVGCGKQELPPEPEAYTYEIITTNEIDGVVSSKAPDAQYAAKVLVNGTSIDANRQIKLAKGIKLADPGTTLVATTESTCGTLEHAMSSEPGYDATYEEAMRKEARRYDGQTIRWKIAAKGAWPSFPRFVLYVDNLDGAEPAVVRIGKSELRVDAKRGERHDVILGDCAEARSLRINGTDAGSLPVASKGPAVLDVAGGHCYQVRTAAYGNRGMAPPPPAYFRGETRHVVAVPRVDNPFRENAETTTVEVRAKYAEQDQENAGAWRTSLTRYPCDLIKAPK